MALVFPEMRKSLRAWSRACFPICLLRPAGRLVVPLPVGGEDGSLPTASVAVQRAGTYRQKTGNLAAPRHSPAMRHKDTGEARILILIQLWGSHVRGPSVD